MRQKRGIGERYKKFLAYQTGGDTSEGWAAPHWCCNACRQMLDPAYEIDHVTSLMLGGADSEVNLQALCSSCHSKKTTEDHKERDRRRAMANARKPRKCVACQQVYSRFIEHKCPLITGNDDEVVYTNPFQFYACNKKKEILST